MSGIMQHHLVCHVDILLRLIRHRLSRIQVSIEAGEIAAREVKPQTMSFMQRKETLLWTYWPVWAAVVCLFTLEWLLRKFSNLS